MTGSEERNRTAMDGFIAELRRAWTMAGPPSYEDLRKLSTRVDGPSRDGPSRSVLSRSTTQDILAGHRQHPPRWQWVARFVTVLKAAAAEAGVDPECLGTRAEWKQKHEAAFAAPAEPGNEPEKRDWWHEYRDLVPDWFATYLSLEPAATLIRAYETTVVPGLLQTRDYAEAAIRVSSRGLGEEAIRRLVDLRMRRQRILFRPDAPRLWVCIDEAALRHRLGSAETMRGQISHLIDMARRPNIAIQIIPLDTSINAMAGGPIGFLRFSRADVPDLVYLEQLTGALYLSRSGDVSHYMTVLDSLGIESLSPAESVKLLTEGLR